MPEADGAGIFVCREKCSSSDELRVDKRTCENHSHHIVKLIMKQWDYEFIVAYSNEL